MLSALTRRFLAPPRPAVLSLGVQAETYTPPREQSQFETLTRHILFRFFHNELLGTDDETSRIMQITYLVALPTLVVTMFLFPSYHAFPPHPPRSFWPRVTDHYFYVMYAFIAMGAATVYEWDLLFPDLLDVFILSPLPIEARRLFLARVLALAIFLGLVLVGTSAFGIIMLPAVAEAPRYFHHAFAHATAVFASGLFTATTFLALQGILLNLLGENIVRKLTPLLQGASIMLLLAILLLHPTISGSLKPILTTAQHGALYFPPFWFLGIYERLLNGPSSPLIFHQLARNGLIALAITATLTLVTYPLAYRRRVRQLIEGGTAVKSINRAAIPLHHALHATLLRQPARRAIFHFISQTILRAQRQRVMLAMYAGMALAMAISEVLGLTVIHNRIHAYLLPKGVREAVPIMAFWTVAGLRAVLTNPVDRRGTWLFRTIIGRPNAANFAAARLWVTLWAAAISSATVLILYALSPTTPLALAAHLTAAIGVSTVLADLFLYPDRNVPFTHLRKSAITDLPFVVMRYVIAFPLVVSNVAYNEAWTETSGPHLLKTIVFYAITHIILQLAHTFSVNQSTLQTPPDETDDFPQRLGLRDA